MEIQNTSPEKIAETVESQRRFYATGTTRGIPWRKERLIAFRDGLRKWEEPLYEALWKDLHKCREEAFMTEIGLVFNELKDAISHVGRWSRKRSRRTPLSLFPSTSHIVREPMGCTLIVAPWNYPVQLLLSPLVGAVAAGCTAVLKPSPYVPNVSATLAAFIKDTFEEDHVAVVQGNREVNAALFAIRFDMVFLTGSPSLAKVAAAAQAPYLTPMVLELGGKSPCIVDRDADIGVAARRIAWGKCLNSGQTCIAPDYLFLHEDIKDRFVEEFRRSVSELYPEGTEDSGEYVHMVRAKAFDRVVGYLKDGKVVCGGRSDRDRLWIEPTLLDGVSPDAPVMQEEIFGPIFPILTFKDRNEVADFVTAREKPLAFYYFGRSAAGWDLIGKTSSGGACINDTIMHVVNPRLPFGGVGNSGMGSYHSERTFLAFSHERSVVKSPARVDTPFRYMPYRLFPLIRRFFSVISCLALLLSCGKEAPADDGKQEPEPEVKNEYKFTAEAGWDIYKAGTYRYGPSIIINDDGSLDAWFAASGSTFVDDLGEKLFVDEGTLPVELAKVEVGIAFTTDKPFYDVQAYCPTWNTNGTESMTMSLYEWDSSYATTVSRPPIASKRFIQMQDNSWCEVWNEDSSTFPAGRYLLTLGRGSEKAGVWFAGVKASIPGRDIRSFQDGEETTGAPYVVINYDTEAGLHGVYWDQVAYWHSTDGGHTWSEEEMVLKPTKGARDEFSCCDPGVIKLGDYYYLGYTSTENPAMVENHVYMSRSRDPRGPWEKWDGSGWGGGPVEPVVTYDGDKTQWGAGGPSMVEKDGTLYMYYTWNDGKGSTRVATAPADDPLWPAHLTFHGTAVNTSNLSAADHCDVKYCPQMEKFIALQAVNCISSSAYLQIWASSDGLKFHEYRRLTGKLGSGLHNVGLSGDGRGHIDLSRQQYISYAYGIGEGFSWGQWNTKWNPLKISN